jgi:hypothetical protein
VTPQPDERVRCRCGSATYQVAGSDSLRTCSVCGYLTSFCKCEGGGLGRALKLSGAGISERTRGLIGAAVVSAVGTTFVMALFTSPFFALLGVGIPFALTASFFAQWLRGEEPAAAEAVAPIPAATPRAGKFSA